MRLTPEILEQCYALLCTCPPFSRWNLPAVEDVEFHVTGHKDLAGDYSYQGGEHRIRISGLIHHTLEGALHTMAHEMCHMRTTLIHPHEQPRHGPKFFDALTEAARHLSVDLSALY